MCEPSKGMNLSETDNCSAGAAAWKGRAPGRTARWQGGSIQPPWADSAPGGLALLANGAAILGLFDMVNRGGDLTGGVAHVNGNRADFFGRGYSGITERFDVGADSDDEAVHAGADGVGLVMDRALDALEQMRQFGRVQFGVVFYGDETAKRGPAGHGHRGFLGVNPFQSQLPTVGAFRGDPRHRRAADSVAVGFGDPVLQVLAGHPGFIGDEAGEIHGVVDSGVEEVERKLVILLDALLELLEMLHFDAEARVGDAVIGQDSSVRLAAERSEFLDDLRGCHGLNDSAKTACSAQAMTFVLCR